VKDGPLLDLFRADVATFGARIEENLATLDTGGTREAKLAAIARDARAIAGAACILDVEPALRIARAIEDTAGAGARRAFAIGAPTVDAMLTAAALLARIAAASAHLEGWLEGNAQAVEDAAAAIAISVPPPPSARPRKRVLVVDDSATVREVERRVLERRGYAVDVAMPRMSGLELTSRMKAEPRVAAIPVIIVSHRDREEDRAQGLAAGAAHYLSKAAYDDETLAQVVMDLIGAPSR
jgi:CheY-like chemotaxis protein/HPt (histidine-containing phosphotransfer) domain-containing protein